MKKQGHRNIIYRASAQSYKRESLPESSEIPQPLRLQAKNKRFRLQPTGEVTAIEAETQFLL